MAFVQVSANASVQSFLVEMHLQHLILRWYSVMGFWRSLGSVVESIFKMSLQEEMHLQGVAKGFNDFTTALWPSLHYSPERIFNLSKCYK